PDHSFGRRDVTTEEFILRSHSHTFTLPGFTPWQTSAFLIQPASMTTPRLSLVMGTGVSSSAFIATFFGPPENVVTPGTSLIFLPSARSAAISAAFLPSSRASFHADT